MRVVSPVARGPKHGAPKKLVSPAASTRSPSLNAAIEIFLFRFYRNYVLLFASRPARGAFRDRHDTRVGCGGRDMSQRVFCARTNGMARTAKSCGPGIPVLMPSLRWCVLRTARTTGARESVPGESAKDTVKTIAQGMPVVPAGPVVTAACVFLQAGHGLRPAPGIPAPSTLERRTKQVRLGRDCVAGTTACVSV